MSLVDVSTVGGVVTVLKVIQDEDDSVPINVEELKKLVKLTKSVGGISIERFLISGGISRRSESYLLGRDLDGGLHEIK